MNWQTLLSPKRKPDDKNVIDPVRSPFEMDFDRIVFSHPFRRLQDKTQVHPLPEEDFVHTRLTHSLEVSSVGRSLGKQTGKVILERHGDLSNYSTHDFGGIVAAAALAHDIGNPPFGHSGETAISDFFTSNSIGKRLLQKVNKKEAADLSKFEGNAQGFRILNKKDYSGLRLTYATLAAFSKYPVESDIDKKDSNRVSQKKYGFFQTEKDDFRNIAQETGIEFLGDENNSAWCRHPLAFLVEAADDICYSIIDLEDGCRLGLVTFDETVQLLRSVLGAQFDPNKLNKLPTLDEKIGQLRAIAINQLVAESCELFLDVENDILKGKFDVSLTEEIPSAGSLEEITKVSVEKIYRSRKVMETEMVGYEVLPGLLEMTIGSLIEFEEKQTVGGRFKLISRLFPEIKGLQKVGLYPTVLNILDNISGMTDSYAISFYRKLRGIDLPKG